MWFVVKRLSLAFSLLLACSAFLLISDWQAHKSSVSAPSDQRGGLSKKWKISFITFVTSPLVEEAEKGTQEGLRQAGLVEGRDYEAQTWSAQGDIANLNNIVDASINQSTDLFYTFTTPALQAVSKKVTGKPLIFTLAVDPLSWGLARSYKQHPSNITGVYISLPVDQMLDVIRECIPNAHTLGTIFTPSESNSTFVADVLQDSAQKRGMQLIRVPVSSTSEVSEAADSLMHRDMDAVCQIPDNITGSAFISIARAAIKMKKPLFCFGTPQLKMGGAVAIAADYEDAGRDAAQLAARVMRGENPAAIPLQGMKTTKLVVYPQGAKTLGLTLPASLIARADQIVGADGTLSTQKPAAAKKLSKKWNIHLLEYSNILDVEESEHGIRDGFSHAGLLENQDYRFTARNAQGDMVTLSSMIDSTLADRADLVMTMSTPTLQGALKKIPTTTPIVFTLVASAIAAGAGKTDKEHLPNVTGVQTTSAYDELIAVLHRCMPSARRLGTLFVPSETNSIYNRDKTEQAAHKAGFEFLSLPVNTSSEVSDAMHSLLSQRVDAICQIAGNLTASAFPSIAEPARRAKIPIFGFQTNQAEQGASVVVARDYYDGGKQAATIAVRVMNGENPANIPFQPLKTTRLLINLKASRNCGLSIPAELMKKAARVIQ